MPEKYVHKIPAEIVSDAAKYAAYLLRDTIDQGFKPRFGGDLCSHLIGKIGEMLFMDELTESDIDVRATPFRAHYEHLHPSDDFVLNVDGDEVQVEIKTANVLKPLDNIASGFKFFLNAAQSLKQSSSGHAGGDRLYKWDWVVCIFVNLTDLTYRIMGCVDVDHVGVYPVAGSRQSRHYEIPIESLLPIHCIWEDYLWKDA